MDQARLGRGVAAVGVVLGFAAIFPDFASSGNAGVQYGDDGTILASC